MIMPFIPGREQLIAGLAAATKCLFAVPYFLGITRMFAASPMAMLNRVMLAEIAKLVKDLMTVRTPPCLFVGFVEVPHVFFPV
jgi:hypothetical protein